MPRVSQCKATAYPYHGVQHEIRISLEATKTQRQLNTVLTNSISMKVVLIKPGEFLMGAADSDRNADASERPRHRVEITKPFYLGIYEVTVGQFRQFVKAQSYCTEAERDGKGGR